MHEFELLSGSEKYANAAATEATLYPAWPRMVGTMKDWLESECDPLLEKQPGVTQAMESLRSRGDAVSEDHPATDMEDAPAQSTGPGTEASASNWIFPAGT